MAEDQKLTLTVDIVAAHLAGNTVPVADVPALIRSVFDALSTIAAPVPEPEHRPVPAVAIRASVKPDYIVCLEDGVRLTMLKRYLRMRYGLSPADYRAKWDLPRDYPMVAPNYAEKRRLLAHAIGLGGKRVGTAEPAKDAATAAPAADGTPARKALGVKFAKAGARTKAPTA